MNPILFRDQCVTYIPVAPTEETEETITSSSYRVEVGGEIVTDYKSLNAASLVTVDVSIEDLINPPADYWIDAIEEMRNPTSGIYVVPDSTIEAKVKYYDSVFTKTTNTIVHTHIGDAVFARVVYGKFGSRFPKSFIDQTESKFHWMSGKYTKNQGSYKVFINSNDIFSIYPLVDNMEVRFYSASGPLLASEALTKDKINIIKVNGRFHSFYDTIYRVVIGETGGLFSIYHEFNVVVTKQLDMKPERGSCYLAPSNSDYQIYFHHPKGGLDTIGSLNLVSITPSTQSTEYRLQKPFYRRSGGALSPHETAQSPNVFSINGLVAKRQSVMQYTFDAFYYDLDMDWLLYVYSNQSAYMKIFNDVNETVVAVTISTIGVEQIKDDDGNPFYKISFSATEINPL